MSTIKQAILASAAAVAPRQVETPVTLETGKIRPFEIALARDILMTGPRATPPTWRAIRKTIAYMRNGYKDWKHWNWRHAPRLG